MARSEEVSFDFDKMAELFSMDPEAFEEERRRLIEEEISARPPEMQEKLRQFQWVLDMKRRRCKNPLEACFMFHQMLMEQVYGPDGLLEGLESLKEMLNARQKGHAAVDAKGFAKEPLRLETRILSLKELRDKGKRAGKRARP